MIGLDTRLALHQDSHAWPERNGASLAELLATDKERARALLLETSNHAAAGRATAVGGAAALDTRVGTITSEMLDRVTGYTLTLANARVSAASVVLAQAQASDHGFFAVVRARTVSEGVVTISVLVLPTAFTGTLAIDFAVHS